MANGRTKKTANYVKSGTSATALVQANVQPRTIMLDSTTGEYVFIGDGGIGFPLVGSINPITNPANAGVLIKKFTGNPDIVTNVGGGVNRARIRLKTVRSTDRATFVQDAVTIGVGTDASGLTFTKGTGIAPPFAGNVSSIFQVITDGADGEADVLVQFAAGGAKRITIQYGPDHYILPAFNVN